MPINHNEIAERILISRKIITFQDTKEIYSYNPETGLYEPADIIIEQLVQNELEEDCKTHIVNEVKESIKRQTYCPREKIGCELNKIPIHNGIYDIETETLEPYTEDKIFLTKHPIEALPEITLLENPIDKFLNEVTESQEFSLLLKEIAGYCFYRAMPFQNFFILVGRGANGKSVYLNLLRRLLGEENVSNQSLQALSEGGFAIASLYNRNANIFGDLPAKAFQDVGKIKELTGGDTIEANQKFKEYIKFKNHAKLISSCNEVPETPDQSDAFFRRAIIINFPKSFQDNPNPNLLNELCTKENLWDFFKSSINAFKLAKENNGWILNETTEKKRDKYVVYSNSAVAFCGIALEYDPESRLASEAIYEQYEKYCKGKQVVPKHEIHFFKSLYNYFGNKAFRRRLKDEEDMEHLKRLYVVQGVTWKEDFEVK
jgi:P4 family phage/plasmid primase-like protien